MGEYSDRVRAEIVSDNRARRILYVVYGAIAVAAVCLLGGFATIVLVLGLGRFSCSSSLLKSTPGYKIGGVFVRRKTPMPVGQLRPEKSTEALP